MNKDFPGWFGRLHPGVKISGVTWHRFVAATLQSEEIKAKADF
jgi:hypothetical protein